MNSFVPMPFQRQARIELVNESLRPMTLFYQVDYTIGDEHGAILPKLHGWFNRQNPTVAGQDFVLLHERVGTGRFLGSVIGIQPLGSAWWGEGEVKFYMDDDGEFATIVGTGSEDYVGLSWGIQQAPFLYLGANRVDNEEGTESGPVSMYRWHVQDPIFWQEKSVSRCSRLATRDPRRPWMTTSGISSNEKMTGAPQHSGTPNNSHPCLGV
jgi:hypothetical protein